jgi:hypothetical protein
LVFFGEVAAEIREMEKNMPFTISVPIRLQENSFSGSKYNTSSYFFSIYDISVSATSAFSSSFCLWPLPLLCVSIVPLYRK